MTEIEKNKNGKCLVISDFILPDDDELIRRPFAYWHTQIHQSTSLFAFKVHVRTYDGQIFMRFYDKNLFYIVQGS